VQNLILRPIYKKKLFRYKKPFRPNLTSKLAKRANRTLWWRGNMYDFCTAILEQVIYYHVWFGYKTNRAKIKTTFEHIQHITYNPNNHFVAVIQYGYQTTQNLMLISHFGVL
jgi:hypothetical protein